MLDDKDQELHDISDCEPENKLRDFNNLLDLDGSNNMDANFVYDDDILSEKIFIKSMQILVIYIEHYVFFFFFWEEMIIVLLKRGIRTKIRN